MLKVKLLLTLTQMASSFSFAFFFVIRGQVFTLCKDLYQRTILSPAKRVDITFHLGNRCQDSWWYLENPFVSANFTEGTRFLRENKTRMYSSRMRTARPLPYGEVSVGGVSVQGGLCLGGLCPTGSLSGGICPGVLCSGGLCLGGLCPGKSLSRGSLSMLGDIGNKRAVRNLLECILIDFQCSSWNPFSQTRVKISF